MLFSFYLLWDALHVSSVQIFAEIVAMKIGNVAIIPQYL